VLDIGCGTGSLTLRALQRGAYVKGMDINGAMLERAQLRIEQAHLQARLLGLEERGVAELSAEGPESYDAVMSGLCFSELSGEELAYALQEISRILKPGGLLLIADEVRPLSWYKRMITWLLRSPLSIITYLLVQKTTRPIKDLPGLLRERGFLIQSIRLNPLENFAELVARKPGCSGISS